MRKSHIIRRLSTDFARVFRDLRRGYAGTAEGFKCRRSSMQTIWQGIRRRKCVCRKVVPLWIEERLLS